MDAHAAPFGRGARAARGVGRRTSRARAPSAMGLLPPAKGDSDASATVLVIKDRLVTKDRDSRAVLARLVLREGRLRDDAVGQAVASIRRLGHPRRISLETDNGPVLA
eukprot:10009908-Alexandrium_andersonii.AAC.1